MANNILNKDPFTYAEDRRSFLQDLHRFHSSRGTPFDRIPLIGGREVDLYRLYRRVIDLGGWQKVNNEQLWEDILEEFKIPGACTNGTQAFKYIYFRYLNIYEKVHFLGVDPDQTEEDGEDGPARKKVCLPVESVPLTYSYGQHKIADSQRSAGRLSTDLARFSDYEKLEMALRSGLPNEVDFALNVCLLLSNEGRHVLKLGKSLHLLTLLLANVGIFEDGPASLEEVLQDSWRKGSKRDFLRFWHENVTDDEMRKMIKTKGKVYSRKDALGYEVLNLGREQGAQDAEGQRVLQVAMLLRNLSFEEFNQGVLASNALVFRFLLLCVHSSYGSLRQQALDTLGNITSQLVLEPVGSMTTHLTMNLIKQSLRDQDKFSIVRALEMLSRLCQVEKNEAILNENIDEETYERIVQLLIIHDIQLIVHTLETLYQLSELGETTTTRIADVKHAVAMLVNLISVEAQAYGPNSLIGIKVVEYVPLADNAGSGSIPSNSGTTHSHMIQPIAPSLSQSNLMQHSPAPSPQPPPPEQGKADVEATTANWLQGTFEIKKGSCVTQADLYTEFQQFCRKFNIHDTLAPGDFLSIVRSTFSQAEVANVEKASGVKDVVLKGLSKRAIPRPFAIHTGAEKVSKSLNVPVNSPRGLHWSQLALTPNPTTSSAVGPSPTQTPTLRQRLMEPPRMSLQHQLIHTGAATSLPATKPATGSNKQQPLAPKPADTGGKASAKKRQLAPMPPPGPGPGPSQPNVGSQISGMATPRPLLMTNITRPVSMLQQHLVAIAPQSTASNTSTVEQLVTSSSSTFPITSSTTLVPSIIPAPVINSTNAASTNSSSATQLVSTCSSPHITVASSSSVPMFGPGHQFPLIHQALQGDVTPPHVSASKAVLIAQDQGNDTNLIKSLLAKKLCQNMVRGNSGLSESPPPPDTQGDFLLPAGSEIGMHNLQDVQQPQQQTQQQYIQHLYQPQQQLQQQQMHGQIQQHHQQVHFHQPNQHQVMTSPQFQHSPHQQIMTSQQQQQHNQHQVVTSQQPHHIHHQQVTTSQQQQHSQHQITISQQQHNQILTSQQQQHSQHQQVTTSQQQQQHNQHQIVTAQHQQNQHQQVLTTQQQFPPKLQPQIQIQQAHPVQQVLQIQQVIGQSQMLQQQQQLHMQQAQQIHMQQKVQLQQVQQQQQTLQVQAQPVIMQQHHPQQSLQIRAQHVTQPLILQQQLQPQQQLLIQSQPTIQQILHQPVQLHAQKGLQIQPQQQQIQFQQQQAQQAMVQTFQIQLPLYSLPQIATTQIASVQGTFTANTANLVHTSVVQTTSESHASLPQSSYRAIIPNPHSLSSPMNSSQRTLAPNPLGSKSLQMQQNKSSNSCPSSPQIVIKSKLASVSRPESPSTLVSTLQMPKVEGEGRAEENICKDTFRQHTEDAMRLAENANTSLSYHRALTAPSINSELPVMEVGRNVLQSNRDSSCSTTFSFSLGTQSVQNALSSSVYTTFSSSSPSSQSCLSHPQPAVPLSFPSLSASSSLSSAVVPSVSITQTILASNVCDNSKVGSLHSQLATHVLESQAASVLHLSNPRLASSSKDSQTSLEDQASKDNNGHFIYSRNLAPSTNKECNGFVNSDKNSIFLNSAEANGILGSPDSKSNDFPPSPLDTSRRNEKSEDLMVNGMGSLKEFSLAKDQINSLLSKAAKLNGIVRHFENGTVQESDDSRAGSQEYVGTQNDWRVPRIGEKVFTGPLETDMEDSQSSFSSSQVNGAVDNSMRDGRAIVPLPHRDREQVFAKQMSMEEVSMDAADFSESSGGGKLMMSDVKSCEIGRPLFSPSSSRDSDLSSDSFASSNAESVISDKHSSFGLHSSFPRLPITAISSAPSLPEGPNATVDIPSDILTSKRSNKKPEKKSGVKNDSSMKLDGNGKSITSKDRNMSVAKERPPSKSKKRKGNIGTSMHVDTALPAMPCVPFVPDYMCEWAGCRKCFENSRLVYLHAVKTHIPIAVDGVCRWDGCEPLQRKRWSLVTHIQDHHCSEMAQRAASQRRYQAAQSGITQPQHPTSSAGPAPALVYPPDAAIQAIKRFHIRPPFAEFSETVEGPVTKHIRLTSALILRNLARYSAHGRSQIKRWERHLSYVSMSAVESSSALSNCLWEILHDT